MQTKRAKHIVDILLGVGLLLLMSYQVVGEAGHEWTGIGMTVLMICHDINIAARFADRIIMLHNGGIFAVGTPEEVLNRENLRTVYGVDADVITANGRPHVIINDSVRG